MSMRQANGTECTAELLATVDEGNYIGNAPSLFDSQGALTNETTREFIQKVVIACEQWIRTKGK